LLISPFVWAAYAWAAELVWTAEPVVPRNTRILPSTCLRRTHGFAWLGHFEVALLLIQPLTKVAKREIFSLARRVSEGFFSQAVFQGFPRN